MQLPVAETPPPPRFLLQKSPKDAKLGELRQPYSYVLLPFRRAVPSLMQCTFAVQSKDSFSW